MPARCEEIAAEIRHRGRLGAEAVHAVDGQQDPLIVGPAGVDVLQAVGEIADRELHAGAGVHPRDADDPRGRRDRVEEPLDHLLRAGLGRIRVELDGADVRAGALRGEPDRLVGRVEVVLGRDDLLAGRQPLAAVHQPDAHRRAVGEGDEPGVRPQVPGGRVAHCGLRLRLDALQVGMALDVEPAAMPVHRLPDGRRRRTEHEGVEVDAVPRRGELGADGVPAGGVAGAGGSARRGRARAGPAALRGRTARGEAERADRRPGHGEEPPSPQRRPEERHIRLLHRVGARVS